jgi:hypothetical protein
MEHQELQHLRNAILAFYTHTSGLAKEASAYLEVSTSPPQGPWLKPTKKGSEAHPTAHDTLAGFPPP